MSLLDSVLHVGAHPGEHQHGVSIQISISLGKTFLRISRIPQCWWIVVGIYLAASRPRQISLLATSTSVNNCYLFQWLFAQ